MKTVLLAAIAVAIATPAFAQSYDPDLGRAGNVVPRADYSGYFGYPGYWGPRAHWGGPGAYARITPWGYPHRYWHRSYRTW
jgi:hypothetical protein